MAFVITQNCCTDASCVPVCPVDCIRPVPTADAGFAPMLYIDPGTCVDCGACVEVCPVDAIRHEDELPQNQRRFKAINSAYFTGQPLTIRPVPARWPATSRGHGPLRVAVVGAGPAACYAVSDLMAVDDVAVNVFERLPTPFGLVRAGVAPDHQRTKNVTAAFELALNRRGVDCYFNVEVGRDISHAELLSHHDAVIYAVGASQSRTLGVPGEHLIGNHAAADVVSWYNGHPDKADLDLDLSGPRTVVVGNGNVALDVARVLVMNHSDRAATDIADHALNTLRDSAIEEVVVLGRRGAADAAFSVGEVLALADLHNVDVEVRGDIGDRPRDFERAMKYDVVTELATRAPTGGERRIVLWFGVTPVEVWGTDRVEGLVVSSNGGTTVIETSAVLRSIGYRGTRIPDLPFDETAGIVPNAEGRVLDSGVPVPGVYVTGWIKRGPRGVIGTNRTCARETVAHLLTDARSGRLGKEVGDRRGLTDLLRGRGVSVVDWAGWRAIDAVERERGTAAARPRVKIVDRRALVDAATGGGA